MSEQYSFCESVHANSYSKWHIRKLTDKGKFLGGGADTLALCGLKVAWDLAVPVEKSRLNEKDCSKCKEKYTEAADE
ncbi:hypothetical protein LCGC14_2805050 [marine sediment metagenome]|uniref:Uncharacterized protein n=1 Tax=marine sediment metagenome TaxID=412755 RepID=A0A0F8YLL0_9ZZZZ